MRLQGYKKNQSEPNSEPNRAISPKYISLSKSLLVPHSFMMMVRV